MNNPIVAIVGRPNVGKSTLFNRLVRSRRAITSEVAGTTRDRLYADGEWQGRVITFVDTGGLTDSDEPHQGDTGLRQAVSTQVAEAIQEADLLMLVIDAQAGLLSEDKTVAKIARKSGKPVIVVTNKADNQALAEAAAAGWELGLGEPTAVSALHGRGTGDLSDRLLAELPAAGQDPAPTRKYPAMTIIGRPNVGKSTLFNKLTGGSRITSDTPQTTRDVGTQTIDTPLGPIEILDTAGVPRRKHTGKGIPKFSLLRTIRAINQSDVVCLLLDGEEGPTTQDAHITSYILEAGKGVVVAVNKWDLVEKAGDIQDRFFGKLTETLGFLPGPPVVFISAATGEKVDRLPRAVYDVWQTAGTEVETRDLNRFLGEALGRLPGGKENPKLYYATQVGTRPPSFVCFVNRPSAWAENHRRFLVNVLRTEYGLVGTPIRLQFRARKPEEVGK